MAESSSWNMRLFLVCMILQTSLLFVFFRPDQSSATPPPPVRDDTALHQILTQLANTLNYTQQTATQMRVMQQGFSETVNRLSEGPPTTHQTNLQSIEHSFSLLVDQLSQNIASTQQQNKDELQVLQQGFRDLVESIRSDNTSKKDIEKNCSSSTVTHIKHTHPELMLYRYTLADPTSNSGPIKSTSLKADFVLLQENGTRFWAKNTYMIDWVFEETGKSGEYNVREAFKAVLGGKKSANLVLDVGSNSGLFSLISAIYGTKRIYAFDPQPLCAQYVAESAQINGFGDRIAVINAFVSKDDHHSSLIPVDMCSGEFNVDTGKKYNKTVNIPAVNLDKHFVTDPDVIDLMKVDVEGAELIVLAGARELFKKHRVRNLIIELTPGWWPTNFNVSYEAGIAVIKEILVDPGYKVWELPYYHDPPIFLGNWTAIELSIHPPPNWHNQKNYLFSLDDIFEH